jgi:protoporphyrinogen oxidase
MRSATEERPLGDCRILIIGAGPTGLGAAYRLSELGFQNYLLVEGESHPGGLSTSFTDAQGFTWDIGGHVLFSHYEYFDRVMEALLRDEWLTHEREAWIWLKNRFVPYPFQQNIRHLPESDMRECLQGLKQASRERLQANPENLEDWLVASFGAGIARLFLLPYNAKVWAYPPRSLSFGWIADRVAEVDLDRIAANIRENRDDCGWGPNRVFRFPRQGGTGTIWRRLAERLPAGRISYGRRLARLETASRKAIFDDGSSERYDILISTVPLDLLIRNSDLRALAPAARMLQHSSTHVIGIGVRGAPPPHLRTKCWMYFPEPDCPFYRATVFSNYSPYNVPDASGFWSLMLEISESPEKPVESGALVDATIAGSLATRLIESPAEIADLWTYRAEYGYPTPSVNRDSLLDAINPELERLGIFSRGRFGSWRYEAGNQDHSFMQGVEVIDRLSAGIVEETVATKRWAAESNRPLAFQGDTHACGRHAQL